MQKDTGVRSDKADGLRIPRPPKVRPIVAYVFAVAVTAVTLAIQHALFPLVSLVPFILFFLSVVLASWVGGRGPGFVAIALSALGANFHFLPPRDQFSTGGRALLLTALYVLVASVQNVLSAALRDAYQRQDQLLKEQQRLLGEAQRAVRTRDDFLAIAGHELRTPMTTLHLQVGALLAAAQAGNSAAREPERLQRVARNIDRLMLLVNELLDVSRIETATLALQRSQVDLREVVQDVVSRSGEAFAREHCEVTVEDGFPVRGDWDPLRLEQVATNILSNAVKYGQGRPVRIAIEARDGTARLAIQDHGIGIAAEDQARVFERFERAVDHRYSGLGLGLWITRQLVEAHGGAIRVESEPGRGSTFTVELPMAQRGPSPQDSTVKPR